MFYIFVSGTIFKGTLSFPTSHLVNMYDKSRGHWSSSNFKQQKLECHHESKDSGNV